MSDTTSRAPPAESAADAPAPARLGAGLQRVWPSRSAPCGEMWTACANSGTGSSRRRVRREGTDRRPRQRRSAAAADRRGGRGDGDRAAARGNPAALVSGAETTITALASSSSSSYPAPAPSRDRACRHGAAGRASTPGGRVERGARRARPRVSRQRAGAVHARGGIRVRGDAPAGRAARSWPRPTGTGTCSAGTSRRTTGTRSAWIGCRVLSTRACCSNRARSRPRRSRSSSSWRARGASAGGGGCRHGAASGGDEGVLRAVGTGGFGTKGMVGRGGRRAAWTSARRWTGSRGSPRRGGAHDGSGGARTG